MDSDAYPEPAKDTLKPRATKKLSAFSSDSDFEGVVVSTDMTSSYAGQKGVTCRHTNVFSHVAIYRL